MTTDAELLHALPGAVLLVQAGRIVLANDASVRLLEARGTDEIHGRPPSDFVHPIDKPRSQQRIGAVAAPDQAGLPNKSSEFRICTCRGNLRMVLISSVAITYQHQPAVLMCGLDMTHQSEIQAQLRESERNYRRLFENMQDVYYRTNAQGVLVHVGPAVRKVLGYEPHEIEGRTAEAFYPRASDRDALKKAILEHGEVSDFPGQMVRRDGTVIDISISSRALFSSDGQFEGMEGLYRDVTQRKNLERELQRLATTDMLTGLVNRRAFLERAQLALQHHQASGDPLALLMLDMDHFKSINDRFGHLEGDQVLGMFARTVQALLPPEGLAGRLGGEEFSVLLPGLGMPEARAVAESLLRGVRAMDLSSPPAVLHSGWRLTVSIGLACARPGDRSLHDLIDRADQALYLAKHRGRDQIASLQDLASPPDNGLPNARTA